MISHQIRSEKAGKIKEGGKKNTRAHNFLCFSSSLSLFFSHLHSQERAPHLISAVRGIAVLPEPPFWKHPLEQRVTEESSLEGEGEKDKEEC